MYAAQVCECLLLLQCWCVGHNRTGLCFSLLSFLNITIRTLPPLTSSDGAEDENVLVKSVLLVYNVWDHVLYNECCVSLYSMCDLLAVQNISFLDSFFPSFVVINSMFSFFEYWEGTKRRLLVLVLVSRIHITQICTHAQYLYCPYSQGRTFPLFIFCSQIHVKLVF